MGRQNNTISDKTTVDTIGSRKRGLEMGPLFCKTLVKIHQAASSKFHTNVGMEKPHN